MKSIATLVAVLMTAMFRLDAAQSPQFAWEGAVNPGLRVEVRGLHGSIRALPSRERLVHVTAALDDPQLRMDVGFHVGGVTVCAVYPQSVCGPADGPTNTTNSRARAEIVVRVPAGVVFSGAMTTGRIVVDGLRPPIDAATTEGDVEIWLPPDGGAELQANTIGGTFASEFPLSLSTELLPRLPGPPPLGRAPARATPVSNPQIIQGAVGRGGAPIRIVTIDGDIRLRRR